MAFIFEGLPMLLLMGYSLDASSCATQPGPHARWDARRAEAAEIYCDRLAVEQRDLPASAHETTQTLRAALLRKDVIVLSIQYFCWSVGVYGFVLWLPTIVRQGALVL